MGSSKSKLSASQLKISNLSIILVTYYCRTNNPKIGWLYTTTILLSLTVLWVDQAKLICSAAGLHGVSNVVGVRRRLALDSTGGSLLLHRVPGSLYSTWSPQRDSWISYRRLKAPKNRNYKKQKLPVFLKSEPGMGKHRSATSAESTVSGQIPQEGK